MDPDAALANIRSVISALDNAINNEGLPDVQRLVDTDFSDIMLLVDSFQALDEWLGQRGFLPRDWNAR